MISQKLIFYEVTNYVDIFTYIVICLNIIAAWKLVIVSRYYFILMVESSVIPFSLLLKCTIFHTKSEYTIIQVFNI